MLHAAGAYAPLPFAGGACKSSRGFPFGNSLLVTRIHWQGIAFARASTLAFDRAINSSPDGCRHTLHTFRPAWRCRHVNTSMLAGEDAIDQVPTRWNMKLQSLAEVSWPAAWSPQAPVWARPWTMLTIASRRVAPEPPLQDRWRESKLRHLIYDMLQQC